MDDQSLDSSFNTPTEDSSVSENLPPAETPSVASKGMFMIAMGVGILGIITGIAGIYIAHGTTAELAAIKKQVALRPDPMETIRPTLQEMDERIGKVGTETMRANNGVRETNTQLQRAVQSLSAEIRTDREQINKLTAALTEKPKPAAAPTVARSSTSRDGHSGSDARQATVSASGQKIHVIQSGDIFSKLAKQYGVSLQAIIDANPDTDPTRLQIGQKIIIPASK